MELPPPSENQPDQPSSSSRLVTLKYVLWESAFSHISVFSKGNHKLGGKKTLSSLTSSTSSSSVLSINIFFPTELVPEAGRLLLETTGVTVSLRFVRALMHQPAPRDNVYPKTVSQFPVRLLSFHQPGQIRVGLSGFFVGPACEQRFAGGHFEYSLTSR